MFVELSHDSQVRRQTGNVTLRRGIALGLLGGLAGTLVLDLVQVGTALVLGYPAYFTYYVSGITAAGFFSNLGLYLTGDVLLGVVIRYVIGLGLGAGFGLAVSRIRAFHTDATKRTLFSLIYVAVASQPLLAAAPIVMRSTWSVDETWQWFVISFFIHMIYSGVLAAVVNYGLKRPTTTLRV